LRRLIALDAARKPAWARDGRTRRGTKGGRSVSCDIGAYRRRNVIERGFNDTKQ
jgi:hypothetical protein